MKNESASFVERPLSSTATPVSDFAVACAVQNITLNSVETAEVFDIEVADMHEFFANGILVHNCIDSARYSCITWLYQYRGKGNYCFR